MPANTRLGLLKPPCHHLQRSTSPPSSAPRVRPHIPPVPGRSHFLDLRSGVARGRSRGHAQHDVPRRHRRPAERVRAPGRCDRGAGLYCPDPDEERSVQEMVIYGVSFDMVGKQPIVLLKTVESNKFLPIWIGHPEAAAILMKLQGASTPRPMTHDLLSEMLGELDVEC